MGKVFVAEVRDRAAPAKAPSEWKTTRSPEGESETRRCLE